MTWNKLLPKTLLKLGLMMLTIGATPSLSFESNIMTGGATGTYIQFGNDIKTLASVIGRDVTVVESAGSIENIEAVRDRRFTQFGIVQSDVLDFLRTFKNEDPAIRRIVRDTRIVFPLYNEEIHIVTKKSGSINVLADLSGRTVAIGTPNSGTNLTSTFLFEATNIKPLTIVPISASDALKELNAGNIDAFVYVSGAPTKLLLDTSANDDLKLVPVEPSNVSGYYVTSLLKQGTYPWLDKDVLVPTVKAVLMTFEYDPNKNDYFKQSCDAVTEISFLIKLNLDYLKQNGHPKWKQVNLNAELPGWKRAQCVETALAPDYQLPQTTSQQGAISTPATNNEPTQQIDCEQFANPIAKRLCLMKSLD